MAKDKKKKKNGKEKKLDAANIDVSNLSEGNIPSEPLPKMKKKDFEKELEPLQVELVKLQEWVKATGAKICVIFEGRDTAGKGGVIRSITERVSPRVFRVVALTAPTSGKNRKCIFSDIWCTCQQLVK